MNVMCTWKGLRIILGIVIQEYNPDLVLWDRLSHWDLGISNYARLAGPWVLGIFPFPPAQHCDYKCLPFWLAFTWILRIELRSSRLCTKNFVNWPYTLSPNMHMSNMLHSISLWIQVQNREAQIHLVHSILWERGDQGIWHLLPWSAFVWKLTYSKLT